MEHRRGMKRPRSGQPLFETRRLVSADYTLGARPVSENGRLRSRVWSAVEKGTGRRVGVKETWYSPHDARSMAVAKLEAGMLIRIAHQQPDNRHLVAFHKLYWDTTTHRYWVVMPWCDGKTLHDHIVEHDSARLSEAEAQVMFAQLVQALHGLHSIGIVHRDIKPANVLLCKPASGDGAPTAVLADYGLAAGSGLPDVFHGKRVGTLEYLPPEMVQSSPVATTASDIWALGVVLYNMLSGRAPFDPAHGDVADAIRRGQFYVPRRHFPGVSPRAKRLIHQCMQMQPTARPSAQVLLDHPWVKEGLNALRLQQAPAARPKHHVGRGMGAPTPAAAAAAAAAQPMPAPAPAVAVVPPALVASRPPSTPPTEAASDASMAPATDSATESAAGSAGESATESTTLVTTPAIADAWAAALAHQKAQGLWGAEAASSIGTTPSLGSCISASSGSIASLHAMSTGSSSNSNGNHPAVQCVSQAAAYLPATCIT